jgi:diketogulonate reductase-like aldo/keto reductase
MSAVTQQIKFNNGLSYGALGFGTWQAPPGVVGESVKVAIKAGFRHIDCARVYQNEKEIGAALKDVFANEAEYGVKRSDLFITSKLWNSDHHPENVGAACRRSLADLGLEYLDLYLIHWPVAWKHNGPDALFPFKADGCADVEDVPLEVTYAAMEKLVDEGLCKSIGVSNFNEAQLRSLLSQCRIKPVCNQVEVSAALPQFALRKVHEELGIATTAYCPLGIGMGGGKGLMGDATIISLAEREGRTPAELLLRYALQLGCSVLSKSVTKERIEANANVDMKPLSDATMAAIAEFAAATPCRICNPATFRATKGDFFPDCTTA